MHANETHKASGIVTMLGADGAKIHDGVRPLEHEVVSQKHYPNAFRETALLAHLRAEGIGRLVICGMMTHLCVDAGARAAFLAPLFLPAILRLVGIPGGAIVGALAALGVVLIVGFIVVPALSTAGLLVAGVLGLAGVIALAIVLPFLAPLLIAIIPIAILVKLVSR